MKKSGAIILIEYEKNKNREVLVGRDTSWLSENEEVHNYLMTYDINIKDKELMKTNKFKTVEEAMDYYFTPLTQKINSLIEKDNQLIKYLPIQFSYPVRVTDEQGNYYFRSRLRVGNSPKIGFPKGGFHTVIDGYTEGYKNTSAAAFRELFEETGIDETVISNLTKIETKQFNDGYNLFYAKINNREYSLINTKILNRRMRCCGELIDLQFVNVKDLDNSSFQNKVSKSVFNYYIESIKYKNTTKFVHFPNLYERKNIEDKIEDIYAQIFAAASCWPLAGNGPDGPQKTDHMASG
jgi:8-oxo-dGTP pyrophosphatase MutT (NUDIX family)